MIFMALFNNTEGKFLIFQKNSIYKKMPTKHMSFQRIKCTRK